jgi:acyl-coenzyme A thioesterase 13
MTTPSTHIPSGVPAGFGPIFRTSPLLDALGNFYSRGADADLEIGLLVDARHTNSRASLHGGVVATFADTGMGYLLAFATDPPRKLVTVSLGVDYIASAAVGDWITILLDSSDTKGRHVFATASLRTHQTTVARVRAVYAVVAQ